MQDAVFGDYQNLVPAHNLRVAAGDDELVVAENRRQYGILRDVQLKQPLAAQRVVVRNLQLVERGFAAVEREQCLDAGGVDLALQQTRNVVGAGNRDVDAQLFHDSSIFRVVDPGDRLWHVKNFLCQLAGNQVVLVQTGDRDDGVRAGSVGGSQRLNGGTVRVDGGDVQLSGSVFAGAFVFFDDQRLVSVLQQRLAQVKSNLASADYDNVHILFPL